MDNNEKIKSFSWRNIHLTIKTYPKTSLCLGILMFLALRVFTYGGPASECFSNLLVILMFFPTYVLAYTLKKYGKSVFLHLFWWLIPFYVIALYIISFIDIRLIDSSEILTHNDSVLQIISVILLSGMVLLIHILSGSIVFFLGTNVLPRKPKRSIPWMIIYITVPVAFMCFLVSKSILFPIVKAKIENLNYSAIYEHSSQLEPVECSCIIWKDYDDVVSEKGQKLKCENLWSCDCGRFYSTCKVDRKNFYTGYALYKKSGKLIRKVYYEDGKVNRDIYEFYYDNGQINEKCFTLNKQSLMQNSLVIRETYSEDGEMIEQIIKKYDLRDNLDMYKVYSKDENIVAYADKNGNVRGLQDKIIGSIDKTVMLACDDNDNFIGYTDTYEHNIIKLDKVKNFEKKLLGKYTEDKSQIVNENGEILGKSCHWGKIAYDKDNNIIGIMVIKQGYKEGNILGIKDGKVNNPFPF